MGNDLASFSCVLSPTIMVDEPLLLDGDNSEVLEEKDYSLVLDTSSCLMLRDLNTKTE